MRRFVVLGLLLLACGDDDVTSGDAAVDGGGDAAMDAAMATCDGVDPFPTGDPMGHPAPLDAPAGEARAGRLTEADIPPDPTRLLTWSPGDFVLANDKIAVVIEAAGPSDGYDPWGGKPVGIARVEGGALVDPADFNELIPAVGRHTFEADSVTVMDPGGSGAAVVRAIGTLRPIPFADDLARALAPERLDDMRVAVDYRIEPGAEYVDVRYTVANPRPTPARTKRMHLLFQSKRMPSFGPESGFRVQEGSNLDWLGFADDDATSYILDFVDEDPAFTLELSGAILLQGQRLAIPACAAAEYPFFRIYAGLGMRGARAALWRNRGQALQTVSGTVSEADGSPAAGVRVHVESADGETYYTRTLTAADGTWSVQVPEGAALRYRAFRAGDGVVGPFSTPDFTLPELSTLSITTTDGDGAPLPARIQTRPVGDGEPAPPERFGEPLRPARRTHVVMAPDGTATLRVRPGMHRVIVSHGYEYTLFDSDLNLPAGAVLSVPVTLDHVVDTTGIMCADYHIHTNRSPDAPDSPEFKLRSAAADGLEIPCRSDHEWVREWDRIVQSEGLDNWLFGVTSLELTTFAWGHFGVVPTRERPGLPNDGSIDWIGRSPADVFNDALALDTDPILIVNHPRGATISGYLSAVDYDPVTGEVGNPELWSDNFNALEVFNDSSFDESPMEVADWFSFLNRGQRIWAVGSSDSHTVMAGSPVGYPRTCLRLGMDDPSALRGGGGEAAVRDATGNGTFTVSGGIYLRAMARGGVRPGGEVAGAMPREQIRVQVQAAPWVDVDTLEVWVDGTLVESIPIADSPDVVRFDGTIEIAGGDWVVFHAKGDQPLDPVHPGRSPFAVTMPIFFAR